MQDCPPVLSWIYFLFSSCPLLLQSNMPEFPCHLFAWWSACPSYCYLATGVCLPFDTPCLPSPFVSSCRSACPLLLVACRSSHVLLLELSACPLLLFHPVWLPACTLLLVACRSSHVLLLELSDCPFSWNLYEFCLSCPVVSCLSPCLLCMNIWSKAI